MGLKVFKNEGLFLRAAFDHHQEWYAKCGGEGVGRGLGASIKTETAIHRGISLGSWVMGRGGFDAVIQVFCPGGRSSLSSVPPFVGRDSLCFMG